MREMPILVWGPILAAALTAACHGLLGWSGLAMGLLFSAAWVSAVGKTRPAAAKEDTRKIRSKQVGPQTLSMLDIMRKTFYNIMLTSH